jgi:predicted anti-sigma-YlaC factor YlaD
MDGEDPGVREAEIRNHTGTCTDCRRWEADAARLRLLSAGAIDAASGAADRLVRLLRAAEPSWHEDGSGSGSVGETGETGDAGSAGVRG